MYERKQVANMLARIQERRRTIMVVSGPRQCGKTTAVGQVVDSCGIPSFMYSADNVSVDGNGWIVERWEDARNGMDAKGLSEAILVIDEVQKIGGWSEAVKAEWDYDTRNGRNLKVILLGSSRLLLQKGLEESLAGRFEKVEMTFWTFDEMHEAFGMTRDEYIYFGGFPGLHGYISDEKRWRGFMSSSIITPFLQVDIGQIDEIRNPALMSRVFALGSALSGREVSVNKFQAELNSGSNPTIANYLAILDKTMLLKPLFKYRSSVIDRNNSSPKMQVYDNGFLTNGNMVSFQDVRANSAAWGQWVESAVGAHLLNMSSVYGYEVGYWRETKSYRGADGKTRKGTFEVDFVLRKGLSVVAIEVKSNRVDTLSGIREFRKLFTDNGAERLTAALVVGNQGLTFEEFCRIDLDGLFVDKKLIGYEAFDSIPMSRLDKGQKDQLEILGRINGTVWLDGDDYLVQKDSSGKLRRMRSSDVLDILKERVPNALIRFGIDNPSVLQYLAEGHTLAFRNERLYFDIETLSVRSGRTYEEALVERNLQEGKLSEADLAREFDIKLK